jgi:hypothetical protein
MHDDERDPDVQCWRSQLEPLSARARGLSFEQLGLEQRPAPTAALRSQINWRSWALAACLPLLLIGALWLRLSWSPQRAWTWQPQGTSLRHELAVGQSLQSRLEELQLQVARIGAVELHADSQVTLVHTSTGKHRLRLDQGQITAKIWAPPGHFGVLLGDTEVIDLGCEFDLEKLPAGGRVKVRSGWVEVRGVQQEWLVPEGLEMRFEGEHAYIPVRSDANELLRDAFAHLSLALQHEGLPSAEIEAVLALVEQRDAMSLLLALTSYHKLAASPWFERTAQALDVQWQESHRAAWLRADQAVINGWWQQVPRPPKQWWRYWRDAW